MVIHPSLLKFLEVTNVKRIFGLIGSLILFSMLAFTVEASTTNFNYDISDPEFRSTVDMLSMEGHGNDDLATCSVKQLYYQEVADMFKKGMSKQQILDYYVKEQGIQALKAPPGKGFNLTLWVTPFALLLIVSLLVFFLIKKWKKNNGNDSVDGVESVQDVGNDIYSSLIDEERKKFL